MDTEPMEENEIEVDEFANAKDPFEFLSSTVDEGRELMEFVDTSREGMDHRVCVCGHPVKRHKRDRMTGIMTCSPNAQRCPCQRPFAVLKASDLRVFLRSTRGEGWLHALGQGLLSAQEKGIKLDWLVEMKCEMCEQEAKVMPVLLNKDKKADILTGTMSFLLCDDCMLKVT